MKIHVSYGDSLKSDQHRNYGWGRASWSSATDRLHILEFGEYHYEAVCGKTCIASAQEYYSGTLCPDCAKVMHVDGPEDLVNEPGVSLSGEITS